MTNVEVALTKIAACEDLKKLENWVANAKREGAAEVADAAQRRIIDIRSHSDAVDPDDEVSIEIWKSINALERVLSEERGKTIRLARTRQKIARVGVIQTLNDLALKPQPSEGYYLLRDRNMLDLSAEAIIVRLSGRFSPEAVLAAEARLSDPQAAQS